MKKFFKSLAVVLALALVITSVPATAASAASVSLKSKTVTLYSEPSTGKTEDGKVCKSYDFWKIAKLLNNFDAETMDIKLVSEDTDLVQKSNKKDMIWVADGASFGTTKVKVIVTSLSTEKVLLEKSITVKVKKNATEDTFKCDLENGSEFEVGETVAVTLSRKNTDTDARKLTCADDSVEIVDANGYGTKYNVTFTKAGKFTLVASAYQSAKYPAPTVEKEIEVVVTSDFAASATGARKITVVGSGLTKDITVKRNNVTVAVDSVDVSDDKTTAVINLASKITDATYVVTFGEQSVEFVGEKQRIEEIIVFEDGESVTTGTNGSGNQEIYAHYDVKDQYGDSVRKNYNVSWVSSIGTASGNASTGELTITVATGSALNYGALVIVTGTHTGNGVAKSVQAQLTVGLAKNVDKINVVGLIKAGTSTYVDILPAGFNSRAYGIVFECLDQNGFVMNANAAADLQFASMSPLLIEKAEAVLNTGVQTVTIDGTTYAVAWLTAGVNAANGGVANITALSTKTGNSTPITVELDSAQVVDSFVFYVPGDIVAANDDDVTLTYEAYDTLGNKVTNFNALIKAVSFTNANFKLVKQNDATAKLVYDVPNTCSANEYFDYPDNCVVLIKTNGTSFSETIYVKAAAKAVAIKSYDGAVDVLEGGTIKFNKSKLTYIDQYDRKTSQKPGNITISIVQDGVVLTGDKEEIGGAENLYKINGDVTLTAGPSVTNSTKSVSFVLGIFDAENKVKAGSEKTCTIAIHDITQATAFSLNASDSLLKIANNPYDANDLYTGDAEKPSFGVKATLRNGATVDVPSAYWEFNASDMYNVTGSAIEVDVNKYNIDKNDSIKDSFLDYSVTNADGSNPFRKQAVTVSAVVKNVFIPTTPSAIETIKTTVNYALDTEKDVSMDVAGTSLEINADEGNITVLDLLRAAVRKVTTNFDDSKEYKSDSVYSVFVSPTNGAKISVDVSKITESADDNGSKHILRGQNNNGDDNILVNAEIGDTFVATFTVNGVSVSVNFRVGADKTAKYTNDSITPITVWF